MGRLHRANGHRKIEGAGAAGHISTARGVDGDSLTAFGRPRDSAASSQIYAVEQSVASRAEFDNEGVLPARACRLERRGGWKIPGGCASRDVVMYALPFVSIAMPAL